LGCISIERIFLEEANFSAVNIPGEMLQWGDLKELIYEFFYGFTFSLPNFSCGNILGELSRGCFP